MKAHAKSTSMLVTSSPQVSDAFSGMPTIKRYSRGINRPRYYSMGTGNIIYNNNEEQSRYKTVQFQGHQGRYDNYLLLREQRLSRELQRNEKSFVPSDEEDDEETCLADEFSDFLGQHNIPRPHGDLTRRASSLSDVARSSPPVPIPDSHWKRRTNLISTFSSLSTNDIPISEYSRTQCKAQILDQHWNYKLSFESRESFSENQMKTEVDSETDLSSDSIDNDPDLFDMEDLY